jgi:hypothetical protein
MSSEEKIQAWFRSLPRETRDLLEKKIEEIGDQAYELKKSKATLGLLKRELDRMQRK